MNYFVLKNKTLDFIKNERGSVMVEMGFYSIIFFALCMLLLDFNNVFINRGQLERINNSLASVLRERERFYLGNIKLSKDDAVTLSQFAGRLLVNSNMKGKYQIIVDVVYFKGNSLTTKAVQSTDSFVSGPAETCEASSPGRDVLSSLSAWNSDTLTWLPVYQVTICVPGGESMLKKALGMAGIAMHDLSVSNAVIPR